MRRLIITAMALGVLLALSGCLGIDWKMTYSAVDERARTGDAKAQYNLAVMHHEGLGTIQDYVAAYVWYNLSAAQGHKKAAEARNSIRHDMTPHQVANAQERSRTCLDSKYNVC